MAGHEDDFITVETTLPKVPYPPHESRKPVLTERLLLRPLKESDLPALHRLRAQGEVMRFSAQKGPDSSMEHTKKSHGRTMPPHDVDTYNFGIFLRPDKQQQQGEDGAGEEGDDLLLIGTGGSHVRKDPFGWPAIGYMLSQDQWGKGYASEFVRAFLPMWWALERAETELRVKRSMVVAPESPSAGGGDEERETTQSREMIVGITQVENKKSAKIMERNGFKHMLEWIPDGPPPPEHLLVYCCLRPDA